MSVGNFKILVMAVGTLIITPLSTSAVALKSDREQPAAVDADQIDFDFKTGRRTYEGNVFAKQGTTELTADKIVMEYVDDKLDKAVAWGNPAVFKTLPDGQEDIVTGKGQRIELDNTGQVVTFHENAVIQQREDTVTGEIIVYNLTTEQLQIRGGSKVRKMPDATETSAEQDSSGERSRVVIQPRPKKAPVTTE